MRRRKEDSEAEARSRTANERRREEEAYQKKLSDMIIGAAKSAHRESMRQGGLGGKWSVYYRPGEATLLQEKPSGSGWIKGIDIPVDSLVVEQVIARFGANVRTLPILPLK